ncbi:MAG: hypothetical protein AAGG55_02805 [Pseudomonadota bacterium]
MTTKKKAVPMRVFWLIAVIAALPFTSSLSAADSSELCESLGRTNIDCACVATRQEVFAQIAPDPAWQRLIDEGYRYALGLENTYEGQIESVYAVPERALLQGLVFEEFGGRPENIEDYEAGCVVAGAGTNEFPAPRSTPSIDQYVKLCVGSTGDARYCSCIAGQLQPEVSDREFEAYLRSFSDYRDKDAYTTTEMAADRGKAMGLSGDAFLILQTEAREKINAVENRREQYCSAMLWADQRAGDPAQTRARGGFSEEELAAVNVREAPGSAAKAAGGPVDQARSIIESNCSKQGNSGEYCACYLNDFNDRVVPAASSGSVALAWVVSFSPFAEMGPQSMALMQQIPQADFQSAGMLMMQTMDIGESCAQGSTATDIADTALNGTAKERMTAICIEENDDQTLCRCLTEKMAAGLSEDDFELVVDMREAEFRGAEDPLATVAEQRGLTKAQAEAALMANRGLMGGVMNMDVMACMGGLPSTSGMVTPTGG